MKNLLAFKLALATIIVNGILASVMTVFIVKAAIYFERASLLWFLIIPLIAANGTISFKDEDTKNIDIK